MFKRFLVASLAAIMLIAQTPASVYASAAVPVEVAVEDAVDESAEATEAAASESSARTEESATDASEELAEESADVNEEPAAEESTEVSEEPATEENTEVSEEPAAEESTEVSEEPEATEAPEVIEEELDEEFDVLTSDISREVSWSEPEDNYIDFSISSTGYANYNEYYGDSGYYYAYFSETEDFEAGTYTTKSYNSATFVYDDYGNFKGVEYTCGFWGKENTTYYVKVVWYSYKTYESVDVDTFTVTTKDEREISLKLEYEEPENNIINIDLYVDGINNYDELNNYQTNYMLYFSESEDFSIYETHYISLSTDSDSSGNFRVKGSSIYVGKANTKYYIKLVAQEYNSYEYTDIEVFELTTKEEKVITRSLEVVEPEYNLINYSVYLIGYDSWSEYYNDKYSYYIYVSEDADFTTYDRKWVNLYSKTENDEFIMYSEKAFYGDPNTTYYLKLVGEFYNNETYQYESVDFAVEEVTTKDEKVITRNLEITDPEYNIVEYSVSLEGYDNWNEFNALGISYYVYISEDEEFTEDEYNWLSWSSKTENDQYIIYSNRYFYGKPNTTYYIKLTGQYYDEKAYEDVYVDYAVKEVTTKDEVTIDSNIEPSVVGASMATLKTTFDEIDYQFINDYLYLQVSTDASFESISSNSNLWAYEETNLQEGIQITYNNLFPGTKYYARLAIRTDNSGTYKGIGDVVEFTTKENVTYDEKDIPDAVLREAIRANVSSFDTVGFEKLTFLELRRKSGEDAIADLTGIELLTNLTQLRICYHNVKDLSPVTELKNMKYLYVTDCKVNTIPNLTGLTQLYSLSLNGNFIPAGEFTTSNGNIPEKFRESNYWMSENKNSQRTSEEIGIVVADTYYSCGDAWKIQVEANNTYAINQYTLSIYEGDNLLAENLATTSISGDYRIVDWLIEDIVLEAGTHTLTFVVYAEDVEAGRVTKTITFSDKNVFVDENNRYISRKSSDIYMYFSLYNASSDIVSMELKDATGNTVVVLEESYSYTNTYDNRYNGIFNNLLLRSEYQYMSARAQLAKYLSVGSYDLVITLEDGDVITEKGALIVTDAPVLNSIYSSSNYPRSGENDEIYLGVSGTGLDFSKVYPVVYDDGGNAITTMVEYKMTSESYAIYKLKKVKDADWTYDMYIKLQNNTGKMILNENYTNSFSLTSYAHIYYAEYDYVNSELLVMCEDMEENAEYTWTLKKDYNGESVAECKAVVCNGMAILNFKDAEGEQYDLAAGGQRYYYISASKDSQTIISGYYVSVNSYTASSGNYSYDTSINGYRSYYINDGEALTGGFYLDPSVLTEDSVLTAVLLDEEGSVAAEGTARMTLYEKYWHVGYSFENLSINSDTKYYLEIKDGDQSLGKAQVYVLDPEKPYYRSASESWYWDAKELWFWLSGYWPESMDFSKIELTITDLKGNEIIAAKPVNVYQYDNGEVGLAFDFSEKWDSITSDYPRMYWDLSYDGKAIDYVYGNENRYNNLYVYGSDTKEVSLYYYSNTVSNIYVYQLAGFSGAEANCKYNVYIYLPYETTPTKSFVVTTNEYGAYEFTSVDLAGLKYNTELKKYDIVVTNEAGQFEDAATQVYFKAVEISPFADVSQSSWQYVFVKFALDNGLMSGKGTNEEGLIVFDPNNNMTRAEFVQTLYNKEGKPNVAYTAKFTDVPDGQWYTKAIMWAAENNIVAGKGDKFDVNGYITRQEMATILYKYATNYKGYETSGRAEFTDYTDASSISSWATENMKWALNYGIMKGKGERIAPLENATRAECATMLKNFMSAYE